MVVLEAVLQWPAALQLMPALCCFPAQVFNAHAASILPLAYGAQRDDDAAVAAAWKEVRSCLL